MRSTFDRPYEEEFARRCIMQLYPELEWNLKLVEEGKDPPDLISSDGCIGVEVVRAIEPQDAKLSDAFSRYCGKKRSDIPKHFLQFDHNLLFQGETLVAVIDGVYADLYSIIKKSIMKKTEKLNSGKYPQFKTDAIFVFNSQGFCFDDGLSNTLCNIRKEMSSYCRQFSIAFVYCAHDIFMCNLESGVTICKKISDVMCESLIRDSMYAIGRNSEYDNEQEFFN